MPVGKKQKLITEILEIVLGQKAHGKKSFEWFINVHRPEHFGKSYTTIDKIFKQLKGDTGALQAKRIQCLECDAYFDGQYKFMFEFDEFQHFSSCRQSSFDSYQSELKFNYSVEDWKGNCNKYRIRADKYRQSKTTKEFNFPGGRTAQRAYLDCFRDLLPVQFGLRPTLRICEFEVEGIGVNNKENCNRIEKLLKSKLKY